MADTQDTTRDAPRPPRQSGTRKGSRPRHDYDNLSVVDAEDVPSDGDRIGAEEEIPPDTRKGRSKSRQATTAPPYQAGVIARGLGEMYTQIGVFVGMVDPILSKEIITNAEDCAKSLDRLAKDNPQVRKALLSMIQTSAWGQVLAAHLPIFLALQPVRTKIQSKMMAAHVESQMAEHWKGSGDGSAGSTNPGT